MTLLVTLYTRRGIAFAADSAITLGSGHGATRRPKQTKLHRVTQLGPNGGVVGYFGLARVSNQDMDRWLRRTLDRWPGSVVAADLGVYLRDELNRAVPPADRTCNASGFHIGAFEERDGVTIPVFQYVWNYDDMDLGTGAYVGFGAYRTQEHFPSNSGFTRFAPMQIRDALRQLELAHGFPMWFRNGEVAFSARAWEGLRLAMVDITQNLRGRGFRPPDDLDRWAALAEGIVRTNGWLFALLNTRGVPTIEGPYPKMTIAWPSQ